MTQGNIALLLETKLQSKGYFMSASQEPEEVNLYLNKGVNDFIDEIIKGIRGGSFETNELNLDYLRQLKRTSNSLNPRSNTPTGQAHFTLPTEYRDYIRIDSTISAECLTDPVVSKCRITESEFVTELLKDTYHKTTIDSPVCEIEDQIVKVHTEGFTCDSIVVSYIRKPPSFDIENQANVEYPLPDKTIYRVIDKLATEMGVDTEQNPTKTQLQQQSKLL